MNSDACSLDRLVVGFFREQLADRYAVGNVRRYPVFDTVAEDRIDALRAFGMEHIYPEWERRILQDDAFARLAALMADPARLTALTAVALKSLWRLGRRIPRAFDAGRLVVESFHQLRRMEYEFADHVRRLGLEEAALREGENVLREALFDFPPERFDAFVQTVVSLLRLLADRSLIAAGLALFEDVARVMETRVNLYSAEERAAVQYALSVMREGTALFDTLDLSTIDLLLQGVEQVETDWFADMQSDGIRNE